MHSQDDVMAFASLKGLTVYLYKCGGDDNCRMWMLFKSEGTEGTSGGTTITLDGMLRIRSEKMAPVVRIEAGGLDKALAREIESFEEERRPFKWIIG